MATPPALAIYLHDQAIGTLMQLPGDRNLFVFNEDYVDNDNRPTLSLSFKDAFGGLITTIKPTQTRLPPFFSNLLPEGQIREYLAAQAGIKPTREFYLLWALGHDLPGAIKALSIDDTNWPRDADDKVTSKATLDGEKVLRFSLAGIQLKFSVLKKCGRLTIPADGVGGSWIVKLPDPRFQGVPDNEYAMMEIARCIGINVPETMLVPLETIDGLPQNMLQTNTHAFAIKRFDRSSDGRAIHIEDFSQVFGIYPDKKYESASYRNIAEAIWTEVGEAGITEFIRRFVFNALIGNGDMHTKNWSLIYPDGRTPELAPAYDFVSTLPYIRHDSLALTFVDTKAFDALDNNQFKRFSAKAGLPEKLVLDTVSDTVGRFADSWQNVNNIGIDKQVKQVIDTHLKTMVLWNKA